MVRVKGHTRRVKRRSSSARKRRGVSFKTVRVKGHRRRK